MSAWGTGGWGLGTWGAGGAPLPAPLLLGVESKLCNVKGGTVLGVFGDHFVHPSVIELIDMVGLDAVGQAKYFEPRLDLRPKKILAGFPALPAGTYGLRLTTPYGVTPVLPNAVTYVVFAEEGKVHRVRRRYAGAWATGERLLT